MWIQIVDIENDLRRQLHDMNRSVHEVRQAMKPRDRQVRVPESMSDAVLGQVVDLGFVNDGDLAQILSWAAQDYMSTMVVKCKSEDLSRVKRALLETNDDMSIWPLHRIPVFRGR